MSEKRSEDASMSSPPISKTVGIPRRALTSTVLVLGLRAYESPFPDKNSANSGRSEALFGRELGGRNRQITQAGGQKMAKITAWQLRPAVR